jgi:hypothetical protein
MKITHTIFFLSALSVALGQDVKLTGTWDMKQLDIKSGDTAIVQADDKITLLHREPTEKWNVIGSGVVTNDKVTLSLPKKNATTQLTIESEKTLTGTTSQSSYYMVSRLSSLYQCSNHTSPHHIAVSISEMKRLTDEFHCTGWHLVDTTTEGVTNVIDNMTAMPAASPKP